MKKRSAARLMILAMGFAFLFATVGSNTSHVAETHPPIPLVSEVD